MSSISISSLRILLFLAGWLALGALAPLGSARAAGHEAGKPAPHDAPAYQLEVVASGLSLPWSLAFLPNGDMLVTELPGALRYVRGGELEPQPIAGVPKVYFRGQGGLMDVVLHPEFAANQLLYLTYAQGGASSNALVVMRARLKGRRLVDRKEIFRAVPRKNTPVHYGGRMVFLSMAVFAHCGTGLIFGRGAKPANHYAGGAADRCGRAGAGQSVR